MSNLKGHKKVIAVVQARLGSKRLPGKVLKKVLGKTLVEWICYRLSFAKEIDGVVIATANNKENDLIAEEASRIGVECYRGSETDLIDRYLSTAVHFDADAVVRVCADCPFVDPDVVDNMVNVYRDNKNSIDFICNNAPPTYPQGIDIEILPTKTLQVLDSKVKDNLYREWLTMNIIENRDIYSIINLEQEKPVRDIRLTVDYDEDLKLMEILYSRLHKEGKIFKLPDIYKEFEKDPSLYKINSRWVNNSINTTVRVNKEFQKLKFKKND